MTSDPDGASPFVVLLKKLARVPKAEIDEQERKEAKKRKARKTHRAYAKPGQIIATEPRRRTP